MLMEAALATLVVIAVAAGIGMAYEHPDLGMLEGTAAWKAHYASWGSAQGLAAKIDAVVVGSEVPADPVEPIEWRFDGPTPEGLPEWGAAIPWTPIDAATLTYTEDALRVSLTEGTRSPVGRTVGGLQLEIPGWNREDFSDVVIRARTTGEINNIGVAFNRREGSGTAEEAPWPWEHNGDGAPVIAVGAVQTYGSYFGPFSVHEEEGYLLHERIGNLNPGEITDAQRFFELNDTTLILRPPPRVIDGREVKAAITWERLN